ncbi:MAG: nucleotidyltransferase domain-containing protein [Candidatus Pacearchaeota archaeon]|jgi:predicted nucleotidyltransferase
MIETILGNKTTFRLLRCMSLSPNQFYTAPELYNIVKAGHSSIDQCLRKMTFFNLLLVEGTKRKRYKLNLENSVIVTMSLFFKKEKELFFYLDVPFLSKLSDFVNDCVTNISEIDDIILFGSVAKGKARENSDTDICFIVSKKSSTIELELTKLIHKYKDLKIEHHIFSIDDFHKGKNDKKGLIYDVEKDGFSIKYVTDVPFDNDFLKYADRIRGDKNKVLGYVMKG